MLFLILSTGKNLADKKNWLKIIIGIIFKINIIKINKFIITFCIER